MKNEIAITISDWLVIVAIVIAPILAIQIQKFIEKKKEARTRKMHIFRVLMATRARPLSPLHVEALNMIDIEFYKHKRIINAWKLLLDNFYNYPKDPKQKDFDAQLLSCSERSNNLLTDLLYEMSKAQGYDFDKVLLKRSCYVPKGHGEIEMEQTFIRKSFTDLFSGRKAVPIKIVEGEKEKDSQEFSSKDGLF